MTTAASIIVIGSDPSILGLSTRLQPEGLSTISVRSAGELAALLSTANRYVAVVDGDLPLDEITQINELFHKQGTVPTLTLVLPETYAHRAAATGHPPSTEPHTKSSKLQEVLFKPFSLEEVALRTKALILRAGYELPPPPSVTHQSHHEMTEGFSRGKIVAVFSAKGGVGKSTIAAHLAVGLSQFYRLMTLLVDSDLWFGDAGTLLDVHSKKSIFDLCFGGEPDAVSLRQAVVPHASGVSVLLRPSDLVSVEKLNISSVGKMLAVACAVYDFVVVDTRSALDEMTLQILDLAHQILLVTTPEVSAVGNTSRFLSIAEDLGYRSKVMLVVNRANTGIDVESLERTLKTEVACTVVSAGIQVVQAANEGVPIFSKYPRDCEIFRDLASVVEKVAGRPIPKTQASGHKSTQRSQRSLLTSLRERWTQ